MGLQDWVTVGRRRSAFRSMAGAVGGSIETTLHVDVAYVSQNTVSTQPCTSASTRRNAHHRLIERRTIVGPGKTSVESQRAESRAGFGRTPCEVFRRQLAPVRNQYGRRRDEGGRGDEDQDQRRAHRRRGCRARGIDARTVRVRCWLRRPRFGASRCTRECRFCRPDTSGCIKSHLVRTDF